jgi:SAM-dependent methyltransferase
MRYTFGTSKAAADRLEEIASFFNPLSAHFISRHVKRPVASAVDLGCGPGFSTDMLSAATDCPNVCGLDSSAGFIEEAARRFKRCTFVEHDVTQTPFPVRGDVTYSRFLLSHLAHALELVNLWTAELPNGGKLIIEELEDIHTDAAVFREYLDINDALIASLGASLYVGGILGGGSYDADVLHNECAAIAVSNCHAATWFLPNAVTVWEEEPFILENTTAEWRKEVSAELRTIKESGDSRAGNVWKMRRLVLERR